MSSYHNDKPEVSGRIIMTVYIWSYILHSVSISMNSKKYLGKYTCCVIIYTIFCFALIFVRFTFISNFTWTNESKYLTENITVNSMEKLNKNDEQLIITKDEREDKILDTTVDPQKIEETLQRISNVCEKYNKIASLERTHFLYDSTHNSLYCWIRKVASTSFTKLFADLRGRQVVGNYYKEIEVLAPQSIEELLSLIDDPSIFKFLAVRHPFERIVSSYRDRIEDNSRYTAQAWIYVPKIFHVTRPQLFHFNELTGTPMQQIFYSDRRLKLIPSFSEFITWLLQQPEEQDDAHWSQYHSHCSICQTSFDYILKLDNYSTNDLNYIFTKSELSKNQRALPQLGINPLGWTNSSRTCIYLSNLSSKLFHKLYERYQIDFEMFDYNYTTYSHCTKT